MKNTIVVFHFSPLELFPPTMNFLNCLEHRLPENFRVIVYTTYKQNLNLDFKVNGNKIRIKRLAKFTYGLSALSRVTEYLKFNLRSFMDVLFHKPSSILYFESLSAFTPILITTRIFKKTSVFIHYHEYMTEQEYDSTFLNRSNHRLEKKIYKKAKWISHTNKNRLDFFTKELGLGPLNNGKIFPNFPPANWQMNPKIRERDQIRCVYVGSLASLESLYLREIIEWISKFNGLISLDLYSIGISPDVKKVIESGGKQFVQWKGSANYFDLPLILKQYDVGLIIYKGGPLNTIFSASNKLFEYLTCGLDVWYPQEIVGTHTYDSNENWPKVLRLDFSKLGQYNPFDLASRKPGLQRTIQFSCEEASSELIQNLLNSN